MSIFGLIVLLVLIPILVDDGGSPTGTDLSSDAQLRDSTDTLDEATRVSTTTTPATRTTTAAADVAAPPTVVTSPAPESTSSPSTTGATPETSPPVATDAPTTTTEAPPTTTAPATDAPASADPSYPTLPDGSPVPILAVFDVDTITLTGSVPSDEAASALKALAIANSDFPEAEIVDQLVVNPDVPLSVGVRVLELTSARFPDGSSDVVSEHAAQLDRVANVMTALDNVTVMVVGHSDQRGDADANYALSEQRAVAVVRYLVAQGIAPSRLAARAVGEEELLTLEQNADALELNRRTEFIFYGLLAS